MDLFESCRGLTREEAVRKLQAAGFKKIRILEPGSFGTCEYDYERINVVLDDKSIVSIVYIS